VDRDVRAAYERRSGWRAADVVFAHDPRFERIRPGHELDWLHQPCSREADKPFAHAAICVEDKCFGGSRFVAARVVVFASAVFGHACARSDWAFW
jgi:hypothetical protein